MHRSGTSMVTNLLQRCGLFLGPEEELGFDSTNGEPHWENIKFVALNDKILSRLGGSWHRPPNFRPGWERTHEMSDLTAAASKLINRFGARQPWGWKDPRNSLTLPFWRQLMPDLTVVICVRNPLEVAESLRVRGDLVATPAIHLWQSYYRELLSALPPSQRFVTHYESYFENPLTELQRLVSAIGMQVSTETTSSVCAHVSEDLRHHRLQLSRINAPEIEALYKTLCREEHSELFQHDNECETVIGDLTPHELC